MQLARDVLPKDNRQLARMQQPHNRTKLKVRLKGSHIIVSRYGSSCATLTVTPQSAAGGKYSRYFAGLFACYGLSANTVPPTMHELYVPPHSVVP